MDEGLKFAGRNWTYLAAGGSQLKCVFLSLPFSIPRLPNNSFFSATDHSCSCSRRCEQGATSLVHLRRPRVRLHRSATPRLDGRLH